MRKFFDILMMILLMAINPMQAMMITAGVAEDLRNSEH